MSGGQDTSRSCGSFQSEEGTRGPSKRDGVLKRMCLCFQILLMRYMGVAVCWSVMSPKQPKSGTVGTGELGAFSFIYLIFPPPPFYRK